MSYSDEWLKYVQTAKQSKPTESVPVVPRPVVSPYWHHPDGSTTWKPWAKMTAEERRKALAQREDATPGKPRR